MLSLNHEIGKIEDTFKQWFPGQAFIQAAKIQSYPLLVEEQVLVANAVISRQQEFSTGRWLARQGMQEFGLPSTAIKVGKLRNPLWTESIIGSITHDSGYCVVVLMKKQRHGEKGIGIDLVGLAQRAAQIEGLEGMIVANDKELEAVEIFDLKINPALLLFSLKESLLKALTFYLDDFIDLRSIEISCLNKLFVTVCGNTVVADIFAAKSGNYLITTAKVYQIDT